MELKLDAEGIHLNELCFYLISRNTTWSADVFQVDGRCESTYHNNKGRNNLQSSVLLK